MLAKRGERERHTERRGKKQVYKKDNENRHTNKRNKGIIKIQNEKKRKI